METKHGHTEEKLKKIVQHSKSIADICRALDIRPVGGNYKTIKAKLKEFSIDTSHFTGQGWNSGVRYMKVKKPRALDDILVENTNYNSSKLRKRLCDEGLKDKVCESCNLSEWMNKPIPLELHHLNGVNTDNRIENLQILCANCHAQTDFFRGANIKSALSDKRKYEFLKGKEPVDSLKSKETHTFKQPTKKTRTLKPIIEKECISCKDKFSHKKNKFCSVSCYNLNKSNNIPKVPELIEAFKIYKSFVQVGKFFGVSDNSIRKWVEKYGIEQMIK